MWWVGHRLAWITLVLRGLVNFHFCLTLMPCTSLRKFFKLMTKFAQLRLNLLTYPAVSEVHREASLAVISSKMKRAFGKFAKQTMQIRDNCASKKGV
jgi:hypothetical protein